MALGLLLAMPVIASAKASLRLYPDSDSPRAGGHRVEGGEFTLNVVNRGRGNGDNTAYEVQLLVSVNDPALLTQGTLEIGGDSTTFDAGGLDDGTPTYPCSGRSIPRHGIFPAPHLTVDLGDIEQDQVVRIEVAIEGSDGLEVHFDAFGTGYKTNNRGTRCEDVFNAMGHDVTAIIGGDGGGDDCPVVEISKEADVTEVEIGDEVSYLITVTNASDAEEGEDEEGGCDLTEVVVTEDIPVVTGEDGEEVPAFTIVALDPAASEEGEAEITWQADTLAPGDEVTYLVTVAFDVDAADATVVENTACVDAAELDEPVCATASVAVGDASAEDDGARGPGFWCNQIRFALEDHPGAQLTVDELQGWLDEIKGTSDVFDEVVAVADLAAAQAILCGGGPTSAEEKLVRHLLALWFNLTAGYVDSDLTLDQLCAADVELPYDTDPGQTIGDVLLAAEADLVSGEADDVTLLTHKDIIDFINNAEVAGEDGCEEGDEEDGNEVAQESIRRRARDRHQN